MNDNIQTYIDDFIEEDFKQIPANAFTMNDVVKRFEELGKEPPPRSTIRSKLQNRVKNKELIYVRVFRNLSYYLPAECAKDMELDVEAIMAKDD